MWDKILNAIGFSSNGSSKTSVAQLANNIHSFFVYLNQKINTFFINEFSNVTDQKIQYLLQGLFGLIGVYLTCWIMYEGYQILWGKNNKNIKDFMWEAFLKFIFIALCFFPGAWMELIKGSVIGIRQYISTGFAGVPILHSLGQFGGDAMISSMIIMQNSTIIPFTGDGPNPVTAFLSAIIIWGGFFIVAFPLVMAFIKNAIMFFIAVAIIPLMIYFKIFYSTKDIFVQWLMLLLSNLLFLIFLNIFLGAVFSYCLPIIGDVAAHSDKSNAFVVGFYFIMYGFLLKIFVGISQDLATSLTRISMDSQVGSAIGSGLASVGSTMGMATGVGAITSRVAGKGLIKGATKGTPLAKKAFDKFRKIGGK